MDNDDDVVLDVDDVQPSVEKKAKVAKSSKASVQETQSLVQIDNIEKAKQKKELLSMSSAYMFLEHDFPKIKDKISSTTQQIIDRYAGDVVDVLAKEAWIKESIFNDFFASLTTEDLQEMPLLYKKAIEGRAKSYSEDEIEEVRRLYDIATELQENQAKALEKKQEHNAKTALNSFLTQADYARLSPREQRKIDAMHSGLKARQKFMQMKSEFFSKGGL